MFDSHTNHDKNKLRAVQLYLQTITYEFNTLAVRLTLYLISLSPSTSTESRYLLVRLAIHDTKPDE